MMDSTPSEGKIEEFELITGQAARQAAHVQQGHFAKEFNNIRY